HGGSVSIRAGRRRPAAASSNTTYICEPGRRQPLRRVVIMPRASLECSLITLRGICLSTPTTAPTPDDGPAHATRCRPRQDHGGAPSAPPPTCWIPCLCTR